VARDLVSVQLRAALKQPGCPICHLRSASELRYIHSLLWESVNDPLTRGYFIGSLGYCREHTWQMGLLENDRFGSPLGNSIMYEHLCRVVRQQLGAYAHRMGWARRPWWRRWLHLIWPWPVQRLAARELRPKARCRVCQIGDRAEQTHLRGLLQAVSGSDSELREWYAASDGLCLPHLRQGLNAADRNVEDGARFLVETALRQLGSLQHELSEFERKNAWDNRHEAKTEAENTAWLRALAFFGGMNGKVSE